MIRKILLISLGILLVGYVIFAIVFINPRTNLDQSCKDMKVQIASDSETIYLNEAQIISFLRKSNVNPVGRNLKEIRVDSIEETLKKNKLIKKAKAYKTIDGSLKVEVFQRVPVLRIISEEGSYYVDSEREIMPVPMNFAAYVPVATGKISEEFACSLIYDFAIFLQKNDFWNSQIDQINVLPNGDIELIPRVGDHYIILGKIENYKENLEKLKVFYEKGLNKVGWNRYSKVNLKFKNQIVCTKKK